MQQMILNAIFFNFSWLGLILIGDYFIPVALAWLAWHVSECEERDKEVVLICCLALTGFIVDSVLIHLSIFDFGDDMQVIPLWLITLWACFAATLRHSLSFMQKHILLPIIAGGALAPLSYFAGAKLGAVSFPQPTVVTFLVLSLIWMSILLTVNSILKKEEVSYA